MHKPWLLVLSVTAALASVDGVAAVSPPGKDSNQEKLRAVQAKMSELEQGISSARKNGANYSSEVAKLNRLLKLQAAEIESSKKELAELETKLSESKAKQETLQAQLSDKKKKLRESLSQLPALGGLHPLSRLDPKRSIMTSVHGNMVDRKVKVERESLLALKRDEEELLAMNEKLSEDRLRVEAHVEDLQEKQTVLALNRELSSKRWEASRSQENERLKEFERVKNEERQFEAMIHTITENRPEPAEIVVPSRVKAKTGAHEPIRALSFLDRKGQFDLPISGAIVKQFGKKYDPKTNLYTFNKGIEIAAKPGSPVRSIHNGKVVYAGRLGGYREVVIIDHGKQFYSLAGNLGETLKKVGADVKAGEAVGSTAPDETPLYFEIRQRHVAINPLPWFHDLKLLAKTNN